MAVDSLDSCVDLDYSNPSEEVLHLRSVLRSLLAELDHWVEILEVPFLDYIGSEDSQSCTIDYMEWLVLCQQVLTVQQRLSALAAQA